MGDEDIPDWVAMASSVGHLDSDIMDKVLLRLCKYLDEYLGCRQQTEYDGVSVAVFLFMGSKLGIPLPQWMRIVRVRKRDIARARRKGKKLTGVHAMSLVRIMRLMYRADLLQFPEGDGVGMRLDAATWLGRWLCIQEEDTETLSAIDYMNIASGFEYTLNEFNKIAEAYLQKGAD